MLGKVKHDITFGRCGHRGEGEFGLADQTMVLRGEGPALLAVGLGAYQFDVRMH